MPCPTPPNADKINNETKATIMTNISEPAWASNELSMSVQCMILMLYLHSTSQSSATGHAMLLQLNDAELPLCMTLSWCRPFSHVHAATRQATMPQGAPYACKPWHCNRHLNVPTCVLHSGDCQLQSCLVVRECLLWQESHSNLQTSHQKLYILPGCAVTITVPSAARQSAPAFGLTNQS